MVAFAVQLGTVANGDLAHQRATLTTSLDHWECASVLESMALAAALQLLCAFQDNNTSAVDVQQAPSGWTDSRVAFVYGTLKKGFGNHWLMEELLSTGHACFVGTAITKDKYPLVCGPFQVPFLLNFPFKGQNVQGEVYLIDQVALSRLDELEGVTRGHYERRPVLLQDLKLSSKIEQSFSGAINAEAYFASPSYAGELLTAPHLMSYSKQEAADYVPRRDRPQGVTFLEHIHAWIASHKSRSEHIEWNEFSNNLI